MIDKRLIVMMGEDKRYLIRNVLVMWLSLILNIGIMFSLAYILQGIFNGTIKVSQILIIGLIIFFAIVIRNFSARYSSKMSYMSARNVKKTFRKNIYEKLLSLGTSYREQVNSSEIVQMTVEGVDQLETYFGGYLPQFFYSIIAPLTLFFALSFINIRVALVLLICVPLIPFTIIVIQKVAKKLFSKYWNKYTKMGDTFLENLNGLTTLKIYDVDEKRHREMNENAEEFRKATMSVLTMQLNSITVMDLIAYGGTAIGITTSVKEMYVGNLDLFGATTVILLASEFFLPMRQLGSYFHIATNGMAASEKIFTFLKTEEPLKGEKTIPINKTICFKDVTYGYDDKRTVIDNAFMTFNQGELTALVGESGSGKSTVASIIMGRNKGYGGSIKIGDTELSEISERNLLNSITYVGSGSYLFQGTLRDNLLMGNPEADDKMLIKVLKKVNLLGFIESENGLDTQILEQASNISGGQRQRIALARALLHNSDTYIFDEATSNIDVESESLIMENIYELSKTKTVILISHRLLNVKNANKIYVLENGNVLESGNHKNLVDRKGVYYNLWKAQKALEDFGKDGDLS